MHHRFGYQTDAEEDELHYVSQEYKEQFKKRMMQNRKFSYVNEFQGFQKGSFSPRKNTSIPKIYGYQTGIVVGEKKAGNVETDEYGRIKVLFHWDIHCKKKRKCIMLDKSSLFKRWTKMGNANYT